MFANITLTLTTEVIYAAAWFAIGAATTLIVFLIQKAKS
jgi:hypothetical protein